MAKYMTAVLILAVAILAAVLAIKGGQVITAYAGYGSSNYTYGTTNLTNPAPTVTSVLLIDSPNEAGGNNLTLYGGQQKTFICTGTITDTSGAGDINTVNATIYGPGSYYLDIDRTNVHYTNSSCTLTANDATSKIANCTFGVWYNAAPNTWTCDMRAVDNGGNSTDSYGTDTADVQHLVAIQVPASLAFGTMSPAGTSAADMNLSVQNYGNVRFDLALNGSDMTCTQGTIGVANLHYDCNYYGTDFAAMSPLSDSSDSIYCTGFDLYSFQGLGSTPTPTAKDLPWKLYVNQTNSPRGNCTGTVWFVAQEG